MLTDNCTCCSDSKSKIKIKAKINSNLNLNYKKKTSAIKIRAPASKTTISSTASPVISSKSSMVFGIPVYETNLIASNPVQAGSYLREHGCVVVPCYEGKELATINKMMRKDIDEYPEYKRTVDGRAATVELSVDGLDYQLDVAKTTTSKAVSYNGNVVKESHLKDLEKAVTRYSGKRLKPLLGSFQAHGNPASFHCPSARHVRMTCHEKAHMLFAHVEDGDGWNIEMNFDRVGFRQKGTKIPEDKDMWHRDYIGDKEIDETDSVFGGWINLDVTGNQRFICKINTQQKPGASGFHLEHPGDSANSITIPPGHVIIFYQHLLHAVAPSSFAKDSFRQFVSWRLTKSTEQLWKKEKQDNMDNQTVPRTPSGQMIKVTMSANHRSVLLWGHTIVWALATFKDEYIEQHTVAKGVNKGAVYYYPETPMIPKYNKSMYPVYSKEERRIMAPIPL
jgi:hypothetical protein